MSGSLSRLASQARPVLRGVRGAPWCTEPSPGPLGSTCGLSTLTHSQWLPFGHPAVTLLAVLGWNLPWQEAWAPGPPPRLSFPLKPGSHDNGVQARGSTKVRS